MACDLVEVARQLLLSQVFRGPYRSRPGGRRDWRVLVTDSSTREVLQSLLTVDQVLAENIVRIDNIEDTERLPVDSSAIYLLSSRRGQEEVLLGLRREFLGELPARLFSAEVLVAGARDRVLEERGREARGGWRQYLAQVVLPAAGFVPSVKYLHEMD